jgi:RNA recognition motif-containing protein
VFSFLVAFCSLGQLLYVIFRFGFVEFLGEEDADYAIKILNMIKVYGRPIRVNKAAAGEKNIEVGANLFVGNLDPEVDEKLLFDTFSAFGVLLQVIYCNVFSVDNSMPLPSFRCPRSCEKWKPV